MDFLDPAAAERPYTPLLRAGSSLRSAIDAPRRRAHYEGVEDLAALAASLLWAVTRAHALVDGNKRASIVLADEFLDLNGHRLEGADDDLYQLAYDAAAGVGDEELVSGRIRACLAQGTAKAPFSARYPDVIARLAQ